MNKLIALALRLSGAGFAWEKLNGYKTKIAGIGLMCSGGAMMLSGLAVLAHGVSACPGLDCVVGIVRGLGASPDAKVIGEGFLIFQGGLAAIGVGHKLDKAASAPVPPSPNPPASP